MKGYLISDNTDTFKGLNIAGINGRVVHNKEAALEFLESIIKDKNIGMIIFTEKIADMIPDRINDLKLSKGFPLVVEIPDRHGTTRGKDVILRYVKESIGINL